MEVEIAADDIRLAVSALKGDLNNDHQTSLVDAVSGLQLLTASTLTVHHVSQIDVNNDGHIGIADVVNILQKVLADGPP